MLAASTISARVAARPQFVSHSAGPHRVVYPRRASVVSRVYDVTQDDFEAEVMKSDKPVLVDFWANWCGPCKLVAPLMAAIEQEYAGAVKVVKVEHDANPKLIEQYKVYGLPALIVVKDGKLQGKNEGAVNKAFIKDFLAKHGVPAP